MAIQPMGIISSRSCAARCDMRSSNPKEKLVKLSSQRSSSLAYALAIESGVKFLRARINREPSW
eukprot:4136963-Amphidinium_carterae.1